MHQTQNENDSQKELNSLTSTKDNNHNNSAENADIIPSTATEQKALEGILGILFKNTLVDFSHYRKSTVLRRLSRRMVLLKKYTFSEYLAFIESTPDETEILYDDLLLSYTEFFREPDVFDVLKEKVLPALIEHRSTKDTIRIWVPGCSTGEEVYSLAICFQEFLQESNSNVNLKAQFFGTDLNAKHISTARTALYPDKVRKNISHQRIEHYFDQTPHGLKVTKHIREMCVFAVQNITLDPPFSNIDMVSCRNVLIYFDNAFQETVIPLFHFSLRNDGFLLLGSSESMGRFPDLFNLNDQKINLYSKRACLPKSAYRFPVNKLISKPKVDTSTLPANDSGENIDINRQIDTILLETYSPPCVLIDSSLMIRQFRGRIFPFLEPSTGDASLKLSKMAGDGLMPELYVAIEEAKKKQCKIKKNDITFKYDGKRSTVNISVFPVKDHVRNELCFLILFEKSDTSFRNKNDTPLKPNDPNHEINKLRYELQSTKERLQSIIEEKDDVNQELWASNEEVQSTNEELQSVNEEMEAAKEELESSNEELLALNEEMRIKNIELKEAKDFSENIVETAKAILVAVDTNGNILTINHFAEQLTGYQKKEIIGKNWFEVFIPSKFKNKVIKLHKGVLENEPGFVHFENPIVNKDGSERIISWSKNILKDSSGKVNGVFSIGMDVTEHRLAEKALKESEEKYRYLVETSQDLIWKCDIEGHYTYLNPAWENTLGYTVDEMIGKKFTDFQPSETARRDMKVFSQILREGSAKGYETVHIAKKGNKVHLMLNAVIIHNDTGDKVGMHGTAHDITEWKTAEQNYQTLFNKMLDGFASHEMIFDDQQRPIDYRFLAVNPAFEKMTGLKSSDIVGRTVMEALPDTEKYWVETYGKVVTSGTPTFIENYHANLQKHFAVTAFRPAEGQFACIFNDITDRKFAEEALKEIFQRFDQLTKQTRTFLWEVNADGLFTFVSPVIEQVLGYTPDEIVNHFHFYDFYPETERESFKNSVFNIFKNKEQINDLHNKVITKSGQHIWLSTYGIPLIKNNGDLLGYRGGDIDITDRKNTEVIRFKLEQQQQQTQRLESLGILAGGIAHDFNNLLGGIFGFVDLAIDECQSTKASQYLTTAHATIERARALTQQLLTFAKGGAPIKKIGNFFPYVQETVQFALSGSNVSCTYDIQKDLWSCNFDKNQIGQVIDNLVINAQQAMPSGGIIELTAKNIEFKNDEHPSLPGGKYVKISIKDYGIGISKEMISLIFDPFFTTKAKGHGLGLSTSYSIINKHGGCIDVESKLGEGSTFHVFLNASEESAQSSSIDLPIKHAGKGMFLVMDDEEIIRMTIQTILTTFGYTVICKSNGKDAIAWFSEMKQTNLSVSAMIFDLTIPGGMGGKEAINEIRKIDRDLPVFVSSGYADDPVMSDPADYGFTASICKPFRITDLAQMLNIHLKCAKPQ